MAESMPPAAKRPVHSPALEGLLGPLDQGLLLYLIKPLIGPTTFRTLRLVSKSLCAALDSARASITINPDNVLQVVMRDRHHFFTQLGGRAPRDADANISSSPLAWWFSVPELRSFPGLQEVLSAGQHHPQCQPQQEQQADVRQLPVSNSPDGLEAPYVSSVWQAFARWPNLREVKLQAVLTDTAASQLCQEAIASGVSLDKLLALLSLMQHPGELQEERDFRTATVHLAVARQLCLQRTWSAEQAAAAVKPYIVPAFSGTGAQRQSVIPYSQGVEDLVLHLLLQRSLRDASELVRKAYPTHAAPAALGLQPPPQGRAHTLPQKAINAAVRAWSTVTLCALLQGDISEATSLAGLSGGAGTDNTTTWCCKAAVRAVREELERLSKRPSRSPQPPELPKTTSASGLQPHSTAATAQQHAQDPAEPGPSERSTLQQRQECTEGACNHGTGPSSGPAAAPPLPTADDRLQTTGTLASTHVVSGVGARGSTDNANGESSSNGGLPAGGSSGQQAGTAGQAAAGQLAVGQLADAVAPTQGVAAAAATAEGAMGDAQMVDDAAGVADADAMLAGGNDDNVQHDDDADDADDDDMADFQDDGEMAEGDPDQEDQDQEDDSDQDHDGLPDDEDARARQQMQGTVFGRVEEHRDLPGLMAFLRCLMQGDVTGAARCTHMLHEMHSVRFCVDMLVAKLGLCWASCCHTCWPHMREAVQQMRAWLCEEEQPGPGTDASQQQQRHVAPAMQAADADADGSGSGSGNGTRGDSGAHNGGHMRSSAGAGGRGSGPVGDSSVGNSGNKGSGNGAAATYPPTITMTLSSRARLHVALCLTLLDINSGIDLAVAGRTPLLALQTVMVQRGLRIPPESDESHMGQYPLIHLYSLLGLLRVALHDWRAHALYVPMPETIRWLTAAAKGGGTVEAALLDAAGVAAAAVVSPDGAAGAAGRASTAWQHALPRMKLIAPMLAKLHAMAGDMQAAENVTLSLLRHAEEERRARKIMAAARRKAAREKEAGEAAAAGSDSPDTAASAAATPGCAASGSGAAGGSAPAAAGAGLAAAAAAAAAGTGSGAGAGYAAAGANAGAGDAAAGAGADAGADAGAGGNGEGSGDGDGDGDDGDDSADHDYFHWLNLAVLHVYRGEPEAAKAWLSRLSGPRQPVVALRNMLQAALDVATPTTPLDTQAVVASLELAWWAALQLQPDADRLDSSMQLRLCVLLHKVLCFEVFVAGRGVGSWPSMVLPAETHALAIKMMRYLMTHQLGKQVLSHVEGGYDNARSAALMACAACGCPDSFASHFAVRMATAMALAARTLPQQLPRPVASGSSRWRRRTPSALSLAALAAPSAANEPTQAPGPPTPVQGGALAAGHASQAPSSTAAVLVQGAAAAQPVQAPAPAGAADVPNTTAASAPAASQLGRINTVVVEGTGSSTVTSTLRIAGSSSMGSGSGSSTAAAGSGTGGFGERYIRRTMSRILRIIYSVRGRSDPSLPLVTSMMVAAVLQAQPRLSALKAQLFVVHVIVTLKLQRVLLAAANVFQEAVLTSTTAMHDSLLNAILQHQRLWAANPVAAGDLALVLLCYGSLAHAVSVLGHVQDVDVHLVVEAMMRCAGAAAASNQWHIADSLAARLQQHHLATTPQDASSSPSGPSLAQHSASRTAPCHVSTPATANSAPAPSPPGGAAPVAAPQGPLQLFDVTATLDGLVPGSDEQALSLLVAATATNVPKLVLGADMVGANADEEQVTTAGPGAGPSAAAGAQPGRSAVHTAHAVQAVGGPAKSGPTPHAASAAAAGAHPAVGAGTDVAGGEGDADPGQQQQQQPDAGLVMVERLWRLVARKATARRADALASGNAVEAMEAREVVQQATSRLKALLTAHPSFGQ